MKKIIVLGGGISGLAILHYLNQRSQGKARVELHERKTQLGGNIQTLLQDGFLFEFGPNGFLNNSPQTLELVADAGMQGDLITSNEGAKRRYIQWENELHLLPRSPGGILSMKLLTIKEKISLFQGLMRKGISKDTTIADYISRRFSSGVADKLIDPFIRGIYGGDIRTLHMEHAFPKMKKGSMMSFKNGMGSFLTRLGEINHHSIVTNSGITYHDAIKADHVISTVPAYDLAHWIGDKAFEDMRYCHVSVVGLGFSKDSFEKIPDGFGFLIPSSQNKGILGCLIESNVYAGRAPSDCVMVRVMLNQGVDETSLKSQAIDEIHRMYGLKKAPVFSKVQVWPKAIPQYEMNYPQILEKVSNQKPPLLISGNFVKGISFNDCIVNAKAIADSIPL